MSAAAVQKEIRTLRLAASERTLAASEGADISAEMDRLNATLEETARKIAAEEARAAEVAQALAETEPLVQSPSKIRMDDPATLRRTVDQLKRRHAALSKALAKFSDPKLGQREEEALAATLLEIGELDKERGVAESNMRKLVHQVNHKTLLNYYYRCTLVLNPGGTRNGTG